MNEVCLVKIATGQRNLYQIHWCSDTQHFQSVLKSLNATKQLRGNANLIAKYLSFITFAGVK
jgi:hypothetical protein